jgi:hypothetical protein
MISTLTEKRHVYRPLDVPSWGDGFRVCVAKQKAFLYELNHLCPAVQDNYGFYQQVIIGWLLMILFAVVSGGLFALYEVIHMKTTTCASCQGAINILFLSSSLQV